MKLCLNDVSVCFLYGCDLERNKGKMTILGPLWGVGQDRASSCEQIRVII
jgi:hypothetical protein